MCYAYLNPMTKIHWTTILLKNVPFGSSDQNIYIYYERSSYRQIRKYEYLQVKPIEFRHAVHTLKKLIDKLAYTMYRGSHEVSQQWLN